MYVYLSTYLSVCLYMSACLSVSPLVFVTYHLLFFLFCNFCFSLPPLCLLNFCSVHFSCNLSPFCNPTTVQTWNGLLNCVVGAVCLYMSACLSVCPLVFVTSHLLFFLFCYFAFLSLLFASFNFALCIFLVTYHPFITLLQYKPGMDC